ncbi:MAG: hypothetical protein ALECFALPRED_000389 [Alectoria fallacina]|uniref:SET domain-containing protein n=1 Tax=Alectoria fallacina TaxID=1903189 RepID=A0A8H3IEK0_9LECA|nr:MAG: hypothetical protein ALECFALPRED_000389 [Alectoria fallacina]
MPNRRPALSAAQRNQHNQATQDQDNEELQSAIERLGIRPIAPPMRAFRISRHHTSLVKSFGWFATQKVVQGTPLLAEKALFEAVGYHTEDDIEAKRDRLLPSDLVDFNALTWMDRPISANKIFDTDCLKMHRTQQGWIKSGLFLKAARLNHSCIPNAYRAWN